MNRSLSRSVVCLTFVFFALGCYPTPGPDKTFTGAVLGAGWGAGAGAVVGNQVDHAGPGAAIGAGFGAVSGMLTGAGLDLAEGGELEQQRQIDALKVQVASNRRALAYLQDSLDDRTRRINSKSFSQQVFFDANRASLRTGSAEQLQRLSESIRNSPYVGRVEVHGHTDDVGDTETNSRLSEARARTVAAFLGSQGISMNEVSVYSHGATKPLASNESEPGRQLNRRVEVVLRP